MKAHKHLDAGEHSFYIADTYTAAEIYGDASLLGRNDISYEQAPGQLEEHTTLVFDTSSKLFKNIWK